MFKCGAIAAMAMLLTGGSPPPARTYDFAPVTAELDRQCQAGTFSGVVVVRALGRDVFERECGQADILKAAANTRATRFKIYSTSKFITALTVMKLVELGTMKLDAPLTAYVKDAPAEWSAVSIRMLLNHTSGIPDLSPALVEAFRSDHPAAMRGVFRSIPPEQKALKTAPGATFAYNNFGFELLADAAAAAAGRPFADMVDSYVFKPARMTNASIEKPNFVMGQVMAVNEPGLAVGYNGAPGALEQATNWAFMQLGAGAIRASVGDFIALDAALSTGKIVSAGSLAEMTRNPVAPTDPAAVSKIGLGVFVADVDGVRMLGHTGGTNGYISDFERYPDDGAMMIALTNRGFVKTRWLREGVAKVLKAAR